MPTDLNEATIAADAFAWATLLAAQLRFQENHTMKKSILSLAAIVVLSASTLTASAAMSGSNPRPQSSMSGFGAGILLYFGF